MTFSILNAPCSCRQAKKLGCRPPPPLPTVLEPLPVCLSLSDKMSDMHSMHHSYYSTCLDRVRTKVMVSSLPSHIHPRLKKLWSTYLCYKKAPRVPKRRNQLPTHWATLNLFEETYISMPCLEIIFMPFRGMLKEEKFQIRVPLLGKNTLCLGAQTLLVCLFLE